MTALSDSGWTTINGPVPPRHSWRIFRGTSSERREYIADRLAGTRRCDSHPTSYKILSRRDVWPTSPLLTSAMSIWRGCAAVTGRLESRYMYSVGVVYNTFPTPPEGADLSRLEPLAQAVSRRPRRPPGGDAGRPLRPRPDAAGPAPRPPRPRPRRRPALPPRRLRL